MENTIHVFLKIDDHFAPKAKYVFRTMLKILGYEARFFTRTTSQDIHIYYGLRTNEKYPVRIYRGVETALFFNKKESYPEKNYNSVLYRDEYIPFLFSQEGEIFSANKNCIQIRKDIIASAFYFLSCWHDYCHEGNQRKSDYKATLAYKFSFNHIPVVERYCDILAEALTMAQTGFQRNREEANRFCLSLSHDIDFWQFWQQEDITKANARMVKRIKSGSIKSLWKYILFNIHKKTVYNHVGLIKKVMRKEAKWNANSSFFLLTKKDFPHPPLNYFSDESSREEIIAVLHKKAVNLLGSKESAENLQQLELELHALEGFSGKGYRARYLNADYQLLFKLLEQAQVNYDSSIGFDGIFGYRAGISYPFYPYNIKENRPFTVLEIPVVITDRTLFFPKEKHGKILLQQLNTMLKNAVKHRSHVSVIWHNHVFDRIEFPVLSRMYWNILQFAGKQQAAIVSTDDVFSLCQKPKLKDNPPAAHSEKVGE